MSTTAFNFGGGKLKYIKDITGSGGDNTKLKLTVDDDYKLVVLAGTKDDSSPLDANTWGIISGTGTLLRKSVYRGNYGSTGWYAVFSGVKRGAVISSGSCVYGSVSATLSCYK